MGLGKPGRSISPVSKRVQHSGGPRARQPVGQLRHCAGRPAAGAGAVGIVLTGMGRDGTAGSAKLVASGGSVIAQDESSSAVWGMPRAVAEAGLASAILPPTKIARRLRARIEDSQCR